MNERLKMAKHGDISREVFFYLVFGVLTTVVNIVAFAILSRVLSVGTVASNIIAWFLSVLFAYVTNRKWVFDTRGNSVLREATTFFTGRIGTGVLDTAMMFATVDLLGWNDLVMKVAVNVIVVILNYVISKFLVFRRKSEDGMTR